MLISANKALPKSWSMLHKRVSKNKDFCSYVIANLNSPETLKFDQCCIKVTLNRDSCSQDPTVSSPAIIQTLNRYSQYPNLSNIESNNQIISAATWFNKFAALLPCILLYTWQWDLHLCKKSWKSNQCRNLFPFPSTVKWGIDCVGD